MKFEELPYYERLHILVTKMRTAHWEAIRFHSKAAADKAHRLGLEIDKITREENLRRRNGQNKPNQEATTIYH